MNRVDPVAVTPAPAAGPSLLFDSRRQLMAAMIGNLFEYYDFLVYAFLAATLARKFFHDSHLAGLLATFAAFGVGFLARPVGGALIGRLADKRGRRVALLITIFGMAIGTVGVGLLPTYKTIGVFAPLLLVLLRLVQGLAAGGEWGSSTAFIVESAPPAQRGLYGGFSQSSIAGSTLICSVIVAIVSVMFTPTQMDNWAWRVPFLLGAILLPVGIYMRRNVAETPSFVQANADPARSARLQMGSAMALMGKAFVSNSIALVVLVVVTPCFGWLSDRIGRKPLLLGCCAGCVLLSYPLFLVLISGVSFITIVAVQILFDLLLGAFSGAGPAALCELFPTQSLTMLMSIGYSLSTALFGGFAPLISPWFIGATGEPMPAALKKSAAGVVSGLVIWTLRETAHERLA